MGALNTGPGAPLQKLAGFPATVVSGGLGQLGREGVTNVLIFNAGASIRGVDLVARFWAEESGTLDWLDDFLRDPQMNQIMRPPEESDEEDEFEETEYVKGELTTLGSDEIY